MDQKNLLILTLGSIIGLLIVGVVGITQLDSNNPAPDPASLSFHERWHFNATLDRSIYHLGENINLTVELICLVDYNVSDYSAYYPGLWEWSIWNNNNVTIWKPYFMKSGEIGILINEFHAGVESGGTVVLHLGTTAERPANSSFNEFHWIPALPPGDYYCVVDTRNGVKLRSDVDYSPIYVPFTILAPNPEKLSSHELLLFMPNGNCDIIT